VAIIRAGMMPFARNIFERVLKLHTEAGQRGQESLLRHASAFSCNPIFVDCVGINKNDAKTVIGGNNHE
jgi:hypothetical protein